MSVLLIFALAVVIIGVLLALGPILLFFGQVVIGLFIFFLIIKFVELFSKTF